MSQAVLVTGGAGYIGSHACKALATAGYRPVVFDNLSRGRRAAVRWGPLVEGDLADRARLCARPRRASGDGGHAFRRLRLCRRIGGRSGALLPQQSRRHTVLAGGDARNGCRRDRVLLDLRHLRHPRPRADRRERAAAPGQPLRRDQARDRARAALVRQPPTACARSRLRYFNAAGADPEGEIGECHEPETHLVPLVLQAALGQRTQIEVYGTDYPTPDGTAIRDYIHVHDLATAHLRALEYLREGGASIAVNLGTGSGHSVREVIAAAEAVSGRKIAARAAPRRSGDPPVLVADPEPCRRNSRLARPAVRSRHDHPHRPRLAYLRFAVNPPRLSPRAGPQPPAGMIRAMIRCASAAPVRRQTRGIGPGRCQG